MTAVKGTGHIGSLIAFFKCPGLVDRRIVFITKGKHDVIFNTIPAPILSEKSLAELPAETLIIELASAPGCIEKSALSHMKQKLIRAASLPGRVAPVSAGKILFETIVRILEEEGVSAK